MRKPSTWIRIIVSVVLLALLLRQAGAQNVVERLRQMNPWDFAIALGLYLLGVWLRSWRWQGLLDAVGYRGRLGRLTELYFVGTFFNQMLPTGIGGDVVRVYETAKDGAGTANAASSVVVDRATGLITLMAMALVTLGAAMLLRPGVVDPGVALIILLVSGGVVAGMVAMLEADRLRRVMARIPLIGKWLEKPGARAFAESFQMYKGSALNKALAVSIVFNFQLVATNYFLGAGLGVNSLMDAPILYYLLFIPIISFVLALPISISGLGAREAAYVALFGSVGVPSDQALALSLSFYAVNLITGAIGGVLYVVSGLRRTRDPVSAEK